MSSFLQLFWEKMMIVVLRRCAWVCVLAPLLLVGCGGEGKDDISKERLESMAGGSLKETVPVGGVVSIDGKPSSDVYIYAHANGEGEPVAQSSTDKEGKFSFSTYLAGDGLPVGTYSLTFKHMPDIPKNKDTGPDTLKGKYRNAKKSEQKVTVAAGTPQTDLKIDLKK